MSLVRNPNTLNQMRDVLQQQSGIDPSQDQIVLVGEVNPRLLKACDVNAAGNSSATGSVTVYTTPSDRDFYLTGIQYSMIKDATCDAATGTIQVGGTVNGQSVAFLRKAIITLTAQSADITREFTRPILIDRGTAISMTATFTAGAMSRGCCITGFTLLSQ